MFQLKSMNKKEMTEYMNHIKKGISPHPIFSQDINEKVDSYLECVEQDSEFSLYSFTGCYEDFEENLKSIKIQSNGCSFALLKLGDNTDNDIQMMACVAELVEFNNFIISECESDGYYLEMIVPENHIHVIKSLEDLENIWKEKILPHIKRIEEYDFLYALSEIEINNYDENNIFFDVKSSKAYNTLREYWRKHFIEESVEEFIGKKSVHFELKKEISKIEIIEYEDIYVKVVQDLLDELQEELVTIDNSNTLVMNKNYHEKYYKYVLNIVNENDGIIYLAKKENNVVGMVAGYIEPTDKEDKLLNRCPRRGRISELVVSKKARGYGIGKKLIGQAEAYFKKNKCEFSQIIVLDNNQVAKKIYNDIGYKPVEQKVSKRIFHVR